MIRVATAVRVTPALWLVLPAAGFATWYAGLLVPTSTYALAATVLGSGTLPFVAAFVAGTAAWEGSRLRRAGIWSAPNVRARWQVALVAGAPSVALGAIAVLAAIAVELLRVGGGLPDARILAITTLDLVAYGLLGLALGLLLPLPLGVPLAILLPFLWLAFVPAMYPVWLRHLTGMFRDCCELAQDLDPRALLASAVVDAGIIAAVGFLLADGGRRKGLPAGGCLVAASLFAIPFVAGSGYAPVVARDRTQLDCRDSGAISVCTWPERANVTGSVDGILRSVHEGWLAQEIAAPTRFTELGRSVVGPDELSLRFGPAQRSELVLAAAHALAPELPDCPAGATGAVAQDYLIAWYAFAAGLSRQELAEIYGDSGVPGLPTVDGMLARLAAASPEARAAWERRAREVSASCSDWDPALLALQ